MNVDPKIGTMFQETCTTKGQIIFKNFKLVSTDTYVYYKCKIKILVQWI